MLREVRANATGNFETAGGLAELQGALTTETQSETPAGGNPSELMPTGVQAMIASLAAQAGLEPEHWLPMFVEDLTSQLRASGDLTIGPQEFAVDRLKFEFDRKTIEGRIAYTAAGARPR